MLKLLPVRKQHHPKGLSLLEVMVAIAVVSMSITALVVISNAAISSVDDSRNQAIADQYVRQALEATRVNRDQNGWLNFLKNSDDASVIPLNGMRLYVLNGTNLIYKKTPTQTEITNICATTKTSDYAISGTNGFYQSVVLKLTQSNEITVTANACYAYRGSTSRKVSVQTILTDWQ